MHRSRRYPSLGRVVPWFPTPIARVPARPTVAPSVEWQLVKEYHHSSHSHPAGDQRRTKNQDPICSPNRSPTSFDHCHYPQLYPLLLSDQFPTRLFYFNGCCQYSNIILYLTSKLLQSTTTTEGVRNGQTAAVAVEEDMVGSQFYPRVRLPDSQARACLVWCWKHDIRVRPPNSGIGSRVVAVAEGDRRFIGFWRLP